MKNGLISIGRMAEINHLSVPALRLYDRMGLLKPAHIDPETGYRYYELGQNARLDLISYMKELGMSLKEIGAILRSEDLDLIEEILSKKNEQIHSQLRELRSRHDAVKRAIASIERYRKSPLTGMTSLEYLDRRRVWGIACAHNFYETGLPDYERVLTQLRETLIGRGVGQVHTYNVGTSIQKADYEAMRFVADEVFIFTDEHFALKSETRLLDSGMYACIYLDGYDQEESGAKTLLAFCRENGYRIAGDYLCEVLTEFNVFDSRCRSMYLRLQVPVRFSSPKKDA